MIFEQRFSWRRFNDFRFQEGMPSMGSNATIGGKEITTSVSMSSIQIQDEARLIYSWNIFNGSLYECFDFKGSMKMEIITSISKTEKAHFVEKWAKLKDVDVYGTLKPPKKSESLLTLGNVAWTTAHFIVDLLNTEVGKDNYYKGFLMFEKHFLIPITLKDAPPMEFYLFEGGDYFISYQEEIDNSYINREIAQKISQSLKEYKTVVNPDFNINSLYH